MLRKEGTLLVRHQAQASIVELDPCPLLAKLAADVEQSPLNKGLCCAGRTVRSPSSRDEAGTPARTGACPMHPPTSRARQRAPSLVRHSISVSLCGRGCGGDSA